MIDGNNSEGKQNNSISNQLDFIPITPTNPRNYSKTNDSRRKSKTPANNIPDGILFNSQEDRVLYGRVYDSMVGKEFSSAISITKHLQGKYSREYGRKKFNVLKNNVQRSIDLIAKNLNISNENDTLNETDDGMEIENDDTNKPESNLLNKSLNDLYGQNQQIVTKNDSLRKSRTNRLSIDPASKSKKARLEQSDEQDADKLIDAQLSKQVKLREKYLLNPKVSFNDFGGIQDVIFELKRLMFHIRNSELYRQLGVEPPRGFLLHGPPGVGKSLLVEALANDLQIPCLKCGATEIVAGISGESEEKIRELFSLAKSLRPCLLFIDEIDAITPKRENAAREMERRIVTQLITCLDTLSDSDGSGDGVMVVGATNRADALDPALRRAGRFDREITLGIPDEKSRLDILQVLCKNIKLEDNFNFESLAHKTPGYVGADLKSLIRESAITALERFMQSNGISYQIDFVKKSPSEESNTVGQLPELSDPNSLFRIEFQDFETALKQIQPSSKREGFATVPDVTWDDIGALSSIRHELQMSILAPVRHADDVKRLGLSLSAGILLCGPPGCGKTLLAKAIANESGINFISVKGPELLNMYVGESERAVRAVFSRARNSKPCVIFFDEIDALCPKRNDSESSSSVTSRVVNQLLTEMDGLESRNCFMLAATNRPDIVDPAILRPGRFDKVLYVGFPTPNDRGEILLKLTKNGTRPPLACDVDLKTLALDKRLDGFSGADLYAIIREASLAALRERIDGCMPSDQQIILQNRHFEFSMNKVKPSVSKKDRIHYIEMIETYNNNSK
ncbi:hypothetical protein BLOT_006198 [Blomia tropicalis]|nr:hypothetical protein BLOT_006198 [Blomia tropicalis]